MAKRNPGDDPFEELDAEPTVVSRSPFEELAGQAVPAGTPPGTGGLPPVMGGAPGAGGLPPVSAQALVSSDQPVVEAGAGELSAEEADGDRPSLYDRLVKSGAMAEVMEVEGRCPRASELDGLTPSTHEGPAEARPDDTQGAVPPVLFAAGGSPTAASSHVAGSASVMGGGALSDDMVSALELDPDDEFEGRDTLPTADPGRRGLVTAEVPGSSESARAASDLDGGADTTIFSRDELLGEDGLFPTVGAPVSDGGSDDPSDATAPLLDGDLLFVGDELASVQTPMRESDVALASLPHTNANGSSTVPDLFSREEVDSLSVEIEQACLAAGQPVAEGAHSADSSQDWFADITSPVESPRLQDSSSGRKGGKGWARSEPTEKVPVISGDMLNSLAPAGSLRAPGPTSQSRGSGVFWGLASAVSVALLAWTFAPWLQERIQGAETSREATGDTVFAALNPLQEQVLVTPERADIIKEKAIEEPVREVAVLSDELVQPSAPSQADKPIEAAVDSGPSAAQLRRAERRALRRAERRRAREEGPPPQEAAPSPVGKRVAVEAAPASTPRRVKPRTSAPVQVERAPTNLPTRPAKKDVELALVNLQQRLGVCGAGRKGVARVTMTLRPNGRVSYAVVAGDFAGTPEGSCIAREVRKASFPRFNAAPFKVTYPFSL